MKKKKLKEKLSKVKKEIKNCVENPICRAVAIGTVGTIAASTAAIATVVALSGSAAPVVCYWYCSGYDIGH